MYQQRRYKLRAGLGGEFGDRFEHRDLRSGGESVAGLHLDDGGS